MIAFPRSLVPFRRTRYAVTAGVVCAGLTVALAGCGSEKDPDAGTNGVGKLSAAKIESKARKAVGKAQAVRLSGEVVTKGNTYKLDMKLKNSGGSGRVTTKNSTFELLRVNDELFLKADAGFWASQQGKPDKADSAAAQKLNGKYVKVPEDDPAYKQFSGFTDKDVLLDGLVELHGATAKAERGDVGGLRTIRVTGDKGAGGMLDVSLEGTPYPLRVHRAGDAGVLRLSDWNKDFELTAPAEDETVDYGKQILGG